ncbi:hypothetical protein K1W69_03785 [Hoeflea sp. WL0058]|uniref:Adenylate cyclase n=1 Tax=Flavimaribacter sediminis TaxID=2865987 RepID=A0AAE2ZHR8_9HYPH|nr:tetratricopeptide repeat protein [Flavimaribacter sediminis]MBW8636299.1 hypothetical protein [Flavimaribacter sediminis]
MASITKMELESSEPAIKSPPEDVRTELQRVLDSVDFRATPRRREMLRYLIEESLAGRARTLKGYTIGVAVFGRGDDFDPQADPVVRLEARRLRRDLDSYYVSEGRNNPLRITIPKGHYFPEISCNSNLLPPSHESSSQEVVDKAPSTGPTEQPPSRSSGWLFARSRIQWISGSAAIAVLLAAIASWLWLSRGHDSALDMTEGPAVAVLPFRALGVDNHTTFLADGISEQIMTALSRFPEFRLYAPPGNTASSGAEFLEQGKRDGLAYIVKGSVASDNQEVRIGASLIEVSSGRIIWAEDYSNPLEPHSLLQIQNAIASDIATALGQPYGVIMTEVATGLPDDFSASMPSYECVLRAYSYRRSFAKALHAPTIDCLQKAVERDPKYAEAWALLGWLYMDAARFGWTSRENVESAFAKALESSEHALLLDVNNIMALKALGSIHHYMGNYEESMRYQRQALANNPNDPDTLVQLGWRLAIRGHFEEGIPYVEKAIARTVHPPGWYYHLIAIDHYMHGRYKEMLAAAKYGVGHESGISWSLVAIAQGALGDKVAAREALQTMAEISPRLGTDPADVYRGHQATEEIVAAIVAGMRNAGWSEPGA